MFICVTDIDASTGKLCTDEAMRTGPALPAVKGFNYDWQDESPYPISCDNTGKYLTAPLYYGTCDDDADTTIVGVIETLDEATYAARKRAEMVRRQPYASWTFDESTLTWLPPVEYPQDGNYYGWDESTTSWVALT